MSAPKKQANSDPLPYVQIDRAAEPTAALLAGHIKESHQHAIGSLYEFWKLCGDPRELEAIVAATPHGQEPEVVLSADEAALRFHLASGHKVEPVVLARLGLLEQRPEGFRVRGMSRSFEPIERRLQARRAAQVGGIASAASRRRQTGSAQPRSGAGSAVAQADSEAPPKRPRSGPEAGAEAGAEAAPNTAVSGQRSPLLLEDLVEQSSTKPVALEDKLTDDEFQVFEHWRVVHHHPASKPTSERKRLLAKWLKIYSVAELQSAIDGCARTPWNIGENPQRKRYDSLELILRDAKHIEDFMGAAKAGAA